MHQQVGQLLNKNLRWVLASEIGTSHIKANTHKQDWARSIKLSSQIGEVSFSIISDGAGSTTMGRYGAALICYSFCQKVREHFKLNSILPNDDELWSWVDHTRELINYSASKRNMERREFSATLLALLITPLDVITLHIGDGSIVARKVDEQWLSLSWPDSGEYASTTYFLIDDPHPKLKISRYKNEFNAFSLFSDGIESLALDFKNRCPHPPFFNSLLKSVDESCSTGEIIKLSSALAAFLNSQKVNERTDDDKSLIIISTK